MKLFSPFIVLLIVAINTFAQVSDDENIFISQLTSSSALPQKLLDTRSIVFHSYTFTQKELEAIQKSFQRTGIDAVAYFETDELLAGKDVTRTFSQYLNKRVITNLIFFQKTDAGYKAYLTEFNTKETLVDKNQNAWTTTDASLAELLKKIYQATGGGAKRLNMLINDVPETDLTINPIEGRRSDFFAIDLKVDELAIPKTGNDAMDKTLEEVFSAYPYKHKFTEPGISEQELRKKGSLYVLCYVHTRGSAAKKLLGYDMTRSTSAIASITYPVEGQAQLKTIPSETFVYKFYFKHIDSGNVFLGTKWDADVTWDDALKNHYRAFKAEVKFN